MRIHIVGGLGDELSVSPLIRELRRRMPTERLSLIEPRYPDLWVGNPHLLGGSTECGIIFRPTHDREHDAGSIPKKFARQFGIHLNDDVPEIFLTDGEKAEAFDVPSWNRTVAIDTWATWASRRWGRYNDLAVALTAAGWTVIEVGRHEGAQRIRCAKSFLNQLEIRRTAALIRRCSLYLGNDSGLFHLAAAVGTPQVVIFGSIPPQRRMYWHTVGVASGSPCQKECGAKQECYGHPNLSRCLSEVTVDQVLDAVKVAEKRFRLDKEVGK